MVNLLYWYDCYGQPIMLIRCYGQPIILIIVSCSTCYIDHWSHFYSCFHIFIDPFNYQVAFIFKVNQSTSVDTFNFLSQSYCINNALESHGGFQGKRAEACSTCCSKGGRGFESTCLLFESSRSNKLYFWNYPHQSHPMLFLVIFGVLYIKSNTKKRRLYLIFLIKILIPRDWSAQGCDFIVEASEGCGHSQKVGIIWCCGCGAQSRWRRFAIMTI